MKTQEHLLQLNIYDHISLGGPMGTQSTPLIATHLFFEKDKALSWLKNHRQYGPTARKYIGKSMKLNWCYDCLAYGFELVKVKVTK